MSHVSDVNWPAGWDGAAAKAEAKARKGTRFLHNLEGVPGFSIK